MNSTLFHSSNFPLVSLFINVLSVDQYQHSRRLHANFLYLYRLKRNRSLNKYDLLLNQVRKCILTLIYTPNLSMLVGVHQRRYMPISIWLWCLHDVWKNQFIAFIGVKLKFVWLNVNKCLTGKLTHFCFYLYCIETRYSTITSNISCVLSVALHRTLQSHPQPSWLHHSHHGLFTHTRTHTVGICFTGGQGKVTLCCKHTWALIAVQGSIGSCPNCSNVTRARININGFWIIQSRLWMGLDHGGKVFDE